MSMNSSAVQLPVIPQQPQDTGLHPALQPGTPDVADLSEPGNTEPVLNNRAATNSSTLVTEDVNQLCGATDRFCIRKFKTEITFFNDCDVGGIGFISTLGLVGCVDPHHTFFWLASCFARSVTSNALASLATGSAILWAL